MSSRARSSPDRRRSLLRITGTMPRSIVSTTSAWCSASRAAHEIASDGMVSASGSRWRGRVDPAPGDGSRSQRSTVRPTRPVKPMKRTASATLKSEVEGDDLLVRRRDELLQQHVHLRQDGDEEQRAGRLEDQVAERQRAAPAARRWRWRCIASTPLPMLAPSTRPSATGTRHHARTRRASRSAARSPGSSTTAPSRTAPISMSSSEVARAGASSSARTAGDSVSGWVAATISCSASVIRPRPISDPADLRRRRCSGAR